MSRNEGVIQTYKEDRGFGFISDPNKERYFFHITDLIDEGRPDIGRKVCFEVSENDRGLKADNVTFKEQADSITDGNKVQCPNCHFYVTPRIVLAHAAPLVAFERGYPSASYCPRCASMIKDFQKPEYDDDSDHGFGFSVMAIFVVLVIGVFAKLLGWY